MNKLLKTVLKSDRNYVRGTDFYIEAEKVMQEYADDPNGFVSKLVFRDITTNLCELSLSKPADDVNSIANGIFKKNNNEIIKFWLVETEQGISERVPFNEDDLVSKAGLDIEAKQITFPFNKEFSPIENIVTLTKYLHYKLMPNISGKWLFGQIDLDESLNKEVSEIKIHVKNAIEGRFSLSDIVFDGGIVGNVRFIVGEA